MADAPEEARVASPCTSVCKMDAATGWCEGCYRTIDEIAAWGMLDEGRKRAIVAALPARRQQAEDASRGKR